MIYDLGAYRYTIKPVIKEWIDYKGRDKHTESMLSISTGCPIVVVCYFIGELYGFDTELINRINRLEKFYKVDKILNKE
jgi:hypothetical protein